MPILTSRNIGTAKRIVVYVGEASQDLGILALRLIGNETIGKGSAIDFVQRAQSARDSPAIIIANPGQLVWYRGGARAMSMLSWHAIPRPTAVSSMLKIDDVKNCIPPNGSPEEHLQCVFDDVITKMTRKDAKIDIIGIGDGGSEVMEYLQPRWKAWADRVDAIVIGASYLWPLEFESEEFMEFWGKVSWREVF